MPTLELRKNAQEVIRVERTTYKGNDLVDVRCWLPGLTAGSDTMPTKKGLSLRPELWRELIPLVERALDGQRREDGPED